MTVSTNYSAIAEGITLHNLAVSSANVRGGHSLDSDGNIANIAAPRARSAPRHRNTSTASPIRAALELIPACEISPCARPIHQLSAKSALNKCHRLLG